MELEYDRSLLGQEHHSGPFLVTEELIREFCDSIGDPNPLYIDEAAAKAAGYRSVIAPPTLCVMFVREESRPDISLKFGRMIFNAGQVVRPLTPVLAGDRLTASTCLKEVYPKTGRTGTMVFVVWETIFTNENGERVAEVQDSHVARE